MAKCTKCGKGGLFRKLDEHGLCETCAYEEFKAHDWADYEASKIRDMAEWQQKIDTLKSEATEYENKYNESKDNYDRIVEELRAKAVQKAQAQIDNLELQASSLRLKLHDLEGKNSAAEDELTSKEKACASADNRLQKNKEILKSIHHAIRRISNTDDYSLSATEEPLVAEAEAFLFPTVELKLNCMNVRQLRKEYAKNQRLIKDLLAKYSKRYTTKANIAIYRLMVIALEAELQNILYNIKYGKLEAAVAGVKDVTEKYQRIASDGNQSIAPVIKRFIGEIEHFFIRAVEIEYEYYVQKERIREEQRALREQMRQEAAERKELERQKKHIEKEESKYKNEMALVSEQLRSERDFATIRQLEERLARLQAQFDEVSIKKEEILKLQTGRAGHVYVISNLGAFGDKVFKVGMTRRLDPMERVKELGDASVPFPFDVHSFIFSDRAVDLESSLHKRLNDRRLNKVNLRKEFFSVTVDELEELVYELEPTAEFNRTLLAEQYNQSLSIDEVPKEYSAFDFQEDIEDDADFEDEFDMLDLAE